tara:strand:+ start:197 stop:943 length:747 start_codon:yes stop_codon:yes gene_type:complete
MASSLSAATLTVTHTEKLNINGVNYGGTNTLSIASVTEVSKRIIKVPTSEQEILTFSDKNSAGTFVQGDVRYLRLTNKDNANFLYLVFTNEYLHEFCVKLDKGQSYIYNPDLTSGVIDTMLANQVAFGFTETTGDTADGSDDITNITANGRIIQGLRYSHDNANPAAGSSVGAITGTANGVSAATAHTLVTRHATTGVESVANIVDHTSGSSDTNGTSTYSSGFGDLAVITAEADTAAIDLEYFIALT